MQSLRIHTTHSDKEDNCLDGKTISKQRGRTKHIPVSKLRLLVISFLCPDKTQHPNVETRKTLPEHGINQTTCAFTILEVFGCSITMHDSTGPDRISVYGEICASFMHDLPV